ncbi:Short transient receptor potential channel 2 [Bagarius yarrelli]|uniref:Short transient receptor potential channel 2 n=1 Tax=Bagarius yarrelli TaxID=175774 RepID=A0A556TXA4_BAGYA|nr:Short transient receptor potential channel 2 [Bagarius yarrelli]
MAPAKIKHVVSFTSEDPKHRVVNLCSGGGGSSLWLCSAADRSGLLKAELQLDRASTIAFIDVGNHGSAFIQVDVGRSSWPVDHPYVTLLPTATLMSPADSRQGTGQHSVRMFKKGDFLPQAAEESWDRLRITCSQPFNKRNQFGLAFFRVRTADEHSDEPPTNQETQITKNQGTPDKMWSVKDWISSPPVQHTFFGQKTGESSPTEPTMDHGKLSRAERMVTAAQSIRRSLLKISCSNERQKTTRNTQHAASSPSKNSSDYPEPPETVCPICGVSFSPDFLPLHASSCLDSASVTEREPESSFSFYPPSDPRMDELMADQWREIVNKKLRFPPELIGAIHEGKVSLIRSLLQTGDGIIRQLEDSEDRQWREALNLSIRLGNEDSMVTLLHGVKFDFRQIHEALLVAVDTNQPRIVKRLLDRLDQEKGNQAIFDHSIDDSQFAPGVTPLTLACQKDLYEIVTMLTQKGHGIPWPHKVSCACLECRNGRQYDLLKFSLSRINTYRGLASRAYLSITAEDAMLSAFYLSRDLRKLSKREPEFKPQYLALEELCQEFAVELLGMCRNQSEVTTILNNCGIENAATRDELTKHSFEEGIPNLARLRLAVNYNQKQASFFSHPDTFLSAHTHPICQQVLSSIWSGSLSGWRGSRTAWKLLVALGIFITMPILCLIYWIAPKSKVGKMLKIPVVKFMLHSASYLWFLITLLTESIIMEMFREGSSTRQQTLLHNSVHMVWVAGFFWFECKEVWIEGLRSYFLDVWNCLDMMVLSMYLASFGLRLVIMIKAREEWYQEDPQLIAEVLFAVTSMLSFTRLAYILPAQESLGTLQISMGKMIDDMIRFLFILMIIGTAFLCGINNIYVSYVNSPYLGSFNETFQFLFWTMFGVVNKEFVDMPDYVLAEYVGRILYGLYTLLIVIVLLNMFVAMITNSYQKIEDDADVEWKFARSKLYLSYFREGLTMPVPFNIIPSPKALIYLIRKLFCCCNFNSTPDYPPIDSMPYETDEKASYRNQVIRALVQRYIESARREFEEAKRKDVGNRITELNKVIGKLHGEMKQIHQTMIEMEQKRLDPTGQSTSSIIGKYIQGAKNNFRDFTSAVPSDNQSTSFLANVHNPKYEDMNKKETEAVEEGVEEEGAGEQIGEEEGVDQTAEEGQVEEDTAGDEICEEDDQTVVEDETMKMEEGRVNEGKEDSILCSSGSQDTGFGSQESELSTGCADE